jgi:hypothetical protein
MISRVLTGRLALGDLGVVEVTGQSWKGGCPEPERTSATGGSA